MENLIIIGTSTTAKTIFQFVQRYLLYNVLGFAVNENYRTIESFCGLPVYAIENLEKVIDKNKDKLFVAILWNHLNADRKNVYVSLKEKGFLFANLLSPKASINGKIIGDNCWVGDFVTIDFDTVIHSNVQIKTGAHVGHESIIHNHCFIGARSVIGGKVIIGSQSFVGLAATIFEQVQVGEKCIVGAATALKRNLNDFSVHKTANDNYITKQYSSDEIEEKLVASKNIR